MCFVLIVYVYLEFPNQNQHSIIFIIHTHMHPIDRFYAHDSVGFSMFLFNIVSWKGNYYFILLISVMWASNTHNKTKSKSLYEHHMSSYTHSPVALKFNRIVFFRSLLFVCLEMCRFPNSRDWNKQHTHTRFCVRVRVLTLPMNLSDLILVFNFYTFHLIRKWNQSPDSNTNKTNHKIGIKLI